MRFDIINTQDFIGAKNLIKGKSYWLQSEANCENIENYMTDLLRDPVDQAILFREFNPLEFDFNYLAQVTFKPGVTDNSSIAILSALKEKFPNSQISIATGDIYFIKSIKEKTYIEEDIQRTFANSLIQRIDIFNKHEVQDYIPSPKFPDVILSSQRPEKITLNISDEDLIKLSKNHLWALELDELKHIQSHYNTKKIMDYRHSKGLSKDPSDIELEIIAQTWSEHCKHKIFNANINYTENENTDLSLGSFRVESIFKSFIKKATSDIEKKFEIDWLISVFTDNAGIVRFDDSVDFCLKVETHNSPSALDPYGGALTGILGVNRDILGCGIGAKPVANTNVLCFAPLDYDSKTIEKLPTKLKHPQNILRGVHRGIQDGGNKSGVPTVNGAMHFHDNYAGKPLVYCGTVGVLPQKINNIETHLKRQKPGDFVVVCGGSVGADGIHGATFSSLELDDDAPSTAVQIGAPFTQRRLTDFLLEARDLGLYNSLTDNGAGGLSSSVGEMAELTNGAFIDIQKVPLKYPGLSPYEIIISESQERMTFSVPKEKLEAFVELAEIRKCNPAVIGEFHDKGSFDIYDGENILASLDIDFLHNSLLPMELDAKFEGPKKEMLWCGTPSPKTYNNLNETIKALLKHPNIKSKEALVRQFDHEVKASTIVKPFIQKKLSGPSDGAVMWTGLIGGSQDGAFCLSSGMAPQVSHIDTYVMTQMSIDEAIRNAVACGTNPRYISVCDNFCWPDPIESKRTPDGSHKLAQLVRSGKALYDTAMIYGTPFISGKDSMKNDFSGKNSLGEHIKISVPPTLLITALGKLDDVNDFMTTDFKNADDLIYYIGPNDFSTDYYSTLRPDIMKLPVLDLHENKLRYEIVHKLIKSKMINSCHDISDGGIITSVIESAFPEGFGVNLDCFELKENETLSSFLFGEIPGGFIVSISSNNKDEFSRLTKTHARIIGQVSKDPRIILNNQINLNINELYNLWSKDVY